MGVDGGSGKLFVVTLLSPSSSLRAKLEKWARATCARHRFHNGIDGEVLFFFERKSPSTEALAKKNLRTLAAQWRENLPLRGLCSCSVPAWPAEAVAAEAVVGGCRPVTLDNPSVAAAAFEQDWASDLPDAPLMEDAADEQPSACALAAANGWDAVHEATHESVEEFPVAQGRVCIGQLSPASAATARPKVFAALPACYRGARQASRLRQGGCQVWRERPSNDRGGPKMTHP